MVLIFTDNEQLDIALNKKIENSRIVYYPDYILEESEATVLIATVQPNKYNFKDFMFKVREKDIQVILLLENEFGVLIFSITSFKSKGSNIMS